MYTDGLADNLYKHDPKAFYGRIVGMLRDLNQKSDADGIVSAIAETFSKSGESGVSKYKLDDVSLVLCKM